MRLLSVLRLGHYWVKSLFGSRTSNRLIKITNYKRELENHENVRMQCWSLYIYSLSLDSVIFLEVKSIFQA